MTKAKTQVDKDAAVIGCVGLLVVMILAPLTLTLGWNFGVSEFVAAAGGHVGHINVIDAFLALLAVRAIAPAQRNA